MSPLDILNRIRGIPPTVKVSCPHECERERVEEEKDEE